jgi:hypothetical protein
MVQSIATFMDACYIARRNAITAPALEHFRKSVEKFHELRNIFIKAGVRDSISLPRQHAFKHFYHAIQLFGSPNGLCSSITESKHIKAVKEPWRRSSRYQALIQMLRILMRAEKMTALRRTFSDRGMLVGTTSSYMAGFREDQRPLDSSNTADIEDDEDEDDGGAASGDPTDSLFVVNLAAKRRMFLNPDQSLRF